MIQEGGINNRAHLLVDLEDPPRGEECEEYDYCQEFIDEECAVILKEAKHDVRARTQALRDIEETWEEEEDKAAEGGESADIPGGTDPNPPC